MTVARPLGVGSRGTQAEARSEDLSKDLLAGVAALFIFAKDYFISVFGLHTEIFGIGLLVVAAMHVTLIQGRRLPGTMPYFSILALAFAWVGSFVWNGTFNTSSYYASFFVAILILVIRPQKFVGWMMVLMALNTGLQLYEAWNGEFLYSYVDDEFEYDEKMLSTNDGALRVKGVYGSPLNAIGVVMSLAMLRPGHFSSWIMLCMASALGQGRLGLGIGLVGLMVLAFSKAREQSASRRAASLVAPIGGAVVVMLIFALFGTEGSVQRMLEATSSDNSQNISRVIFWGQSINEIINFDIASHVFGRFGYIKALQGGTESDWLRLWLDNGIVCLLAYLLPLMGLMVAAWRSKRWPELYGALATLFVMAVYPHAQSLPNGILVWLLILLPRMKTMGSVADEKGRPN